MATTVFICYRRIDSPYAARMIAERVEVYFGRGSVFFDLRSIPLGVDFRTYVDREVAKCSAMLVVIGDKWFNADAGNAGQRLHDPDDDVRIEIESGLRRNLSLVPVLVDQATMPPSELLPGTLQPLTLRNAAEVRPGVDLPMQIDRLVARLQQLQDVSPLHQGLEQYVDSSRTAAAAPPVVDGFAWCYVPEGQFVYGESGDRTDVEHFWITKAPVTNAQYARFVRETGYEPPQHWKVDTSTRGKLDHPVAGVSWYDADMYCRWLSHRIGLNVGLPTQEEWEKAARGTDGRAYPWGDTPDPGKCNTAQSGIGDTMPVGRFSPYGDSPFGCVDMSGNVWEWTATEVRRDKPAFVGLRVMRGGSWNMGLDFARAACRTEVLPYVRASDFGFRLVRRPGHV